MAYTRNVEGSSGGLQGKINLNSTGKYDWRLCEFYRDAEIVGKTGTFKGRTIVAQGTEDDHDAAFAALKAAFVAAE